MTGAGRRIDVAFLPGELATTDVAIVVDALRASSTIASALAGGYRSVVCVASVEEALELRTPDRVLAGERDTKPVEGFDLGNSPADVGSGEGRELVLATTNGTPAIVRSVEVTERVLIGSMLNLDAVTGAAPADASVTVVCAGTGGGFSLDDAYTAGRIVAALPGERTDAALAAERLSQAYPDAVTALGASAHAQVLRDVGQEADIALCARESTLAIIPFVSEVTGGAAIVSASPQSGNADREAPPNISTFA